MSNSKRKNSEALDKAHALLDIAGMVPVIGNVADGVTVLLHAARGNWKGAALSAASMVPGTGQAATAARIGKKLIKVIKTSKKSFKGSKILLKG